MLPLHILGGALALISGYVALSAAKGAATHRKSGMVFVYAMVLMSLTGALIALLHAEPISVVAGLMTFYMVATGMRTVRAKDATISWIDGAATGFALLVAAGCFIVGIESAGRGRPEAYPLFIFGIVGVLGVRGDRQHVRERATGSRRIARHLWRMCFAMWVAAASFFWGPQNRVPELIRIPALQAVAVLAPIAVMVYWLVRLRARRTSRTTVRVNTQEAF